jgi:competence protein ComEA
MRISEFSKQKLKSLFSFLNPQFAIRHSQLFKHFSLSQQRILFVFALLILGLLYFRFYYHPFPPPSERIIQEFVVEVSGEVRNPGIYIFENRPTVKEAIKKAGGLKEVALIETASSSEALETGTLITVVKGSCIKVKIGRMQANKLLVFSIPLDINRVSAEDLCLIPGIGESRAREIVAYRERRRGFRSVEELKNVKGIGEKKWKVLKTFLTITQPFLAKRGVDPSPWNAKPHRRDDDE